MKVGINKPGTPFTFNGVKQQYIITNFQYYKAEGRITLQEYLMVFDYLTEDEYLFEFCDWFKYNFGDIEQFSGDIEYEIGNATIGLMKARMIKMRRNPNQDNFDSLHFF